MTKSVKCYNLVATLQPIKQVAHPSVYRQCYNVTTYFHIIFSLLNLFAQYNGIEVTLIAKKSQ